MNQKEMEQAYLYQVKRTEELIKSMGDNPQTINTFITNTYAALSQKEPAFLWFSLGTTVSGTVGKNLQVATEGIINSAGQVESAKIVLNKFSLGNQVIFKNIVPLFLTYESIGPEGIELLATSNIQNPFQRDVVLEAMKNYSVLQLKQSAIASSLNLPLNDQNVIAQLFSDKENIEMAHFIAIEIAKEEQRTVQLIYKKELLDILLDPTLSWTGNQLKLDEIKILGKSYVLFDYVDNPADFDQRMAFVETLLTAIDEGISKGEFLKLQADVLKMAELTLWMANPNTAPHAISEINGAYWGYKADEQDKKVKESVLSFINDESPAAPETALANPVDTQSQEILPAIFTGEYEIINVNMDPLALFLVNNPNYEVIAHNVSELLASSHYNHAPLPGGTALLNPQMPYFKDSAYFAIYNDGEYHFEQPKGEVRGITFPLIYDKETGTPLTKPIYDAIGHYDHTSTIDTIYNHPEVFNTASHINWYNPYWLELVHAAKQAAMNNYLKSISVDRFMANIVAPFPKSFQYSRDDNKEQLTLKGSDVFHDNSGNIDFSALKEMGSSSGSHPVMLSIVSMELANGTLLEMKNGDFVCVNCNGSNTALLESAANSMLNHI